MDKLYKKILLAESHYRSRPWLKAISGEFHITLLSILKSERKFYLKNNFQIQNLIELDEEILNKNVENPKNIILNFEKQNKIIIAEFIQTDRKLKRLNNDEILIYAAKLIKIYEKYLSESQFKFCFMEITWFHEIILYFLCKKFKIEVYSPVRCKLSFNKFYIFTDYNRKNNIQIKSKEDYSYDELKKEIVLKLPLKENIKLTQEKEFIKLSKRNSLNFDKIRVLIDLLSRKYQGGFYKYIHMSLSWYIKYKIKCVLRKHFFNSFYRFDKCDYKNIKYIYIPLHVQPEAGIDLVGRKYSNQIEFIKRCATSLPVNYHIIVKDHPHDFGRKNSKYYKEIQSINNCLLVHPRERVEEIITNSDLVITIVGTTSLEACLMGIPSLTAVEMYYSKLLVSRNFNPYEEKLDEIINNKLNYWKNFRGTKEFKELLLNIFSNRFQGNVSGADMNKEVYNKENIINLLGLFNYLYDR